MPGRARCASVSTSMRLAQAGHADQQHVAAGEQGDQRLLDHLVLAEDDAADLRAHCGDAGAERLDLGDESRCRRRAEGRRQGSRSSKVLMMDCTSGQVTHIAGVAQREAHGQDFAA